MIPSVAKW